MNTDALARNESAAGMLERVVVGGDLSKLSTPDRLMYYTKVCESVGLNPLTRPFEYITLNNKLVLYAKRDATDQLRSIHGVSITKLEREVSEGIYAVTAYATDSKGRTDTAIGAVPIENLRGEAKANAMMKAETKAKRRVTLSLCGLGMLDETEVGSIPGAVLGEPGAAIVERVNRETGEVRDETQIEVPFDYEAPREHVIPDRPTTTCPECGKDAIIKSKAEWGGGWVCFKKKEGCGAKFPDGDKRIEGAPAAIPADRGASAVSARRGIETVSLPEMDGDDPNVHRPFLANRIEAIMKERKFSRAAAAFFFKKHLGVDTATLTAAEMEKYDVTLLKAMYDELSDAA